GRGGHAVDITSVFAPAVSVHSDNCKLAEAHLLELRLLEVGCYPDVLEGYDREQRLTGLHDLAALHRFLADYAGLWRNDGGVLEVQSRLVQCGLSLLDPSICGLSLCPGNGNLLRSC